MGHVLNAPPSLVLLAGWGDENAFQRNTSSDCDPNRTGYTRKQWPCAVPSRDYSPPQGHPRQPERPAWYGQEGDPSPDDRAVRPPELANTGRDAGITGFTRGESGGFAGLPPEVRPETGPAKDLPSQFRRSLVDYNTKEPAGTIIVDTPNTHLYLTLGNGKATRYGIGVGREGFMVGLRKSLSNGRMARLESP